MPDDHYDVLGVSREASEETIRRAFRRLALLHHPDRSKEAGAAERFKRIVEAYQVLTNPQTREEYDCEREEDEAWRRAEREREEAAWRRAEWERQATAGRRAEWERARGASAEDEFSARLRAEREREEAASRRRWLAGVVFAALVVVGVGALINSGSGGNSVSGPVGGDEWVSFSMRPRVCDGVLEFRGQSRNGAVVLYGAGSAAPFQLYRGSGIEPIAAFLEPPGAGEYYPRLGRTHIVADILSTSSIGAFYLEAEWPAWLPSPEAVTLGVWGYRPDSSEGILRVIGVERCGASAFLGEGGTLL